VGDNTSLTLSFHTYFLRRNVFNHLSQFFSYSPASLEGTVWPRLFESAVKHRSVNRSFLVGTLSSSMSISTISDWRFS